MNQRKNTTSGTTNKNIWQKVINTAHFSPYLLA